MVNKNLAQLQQHLVRKQEWLENELSQRPPSPQLGDIFIFIYPDDEIGSQWVIIDREQNGSQFFIVPADDTPMVGSMDIALPDSALCSPLTLRCDLGLWIQAKDFDLELRVGVLEEWHRRRALEKVKQISQAQFKVQCQKNIVKFLKFWHQGLPKRVYHLIGDMTSIGSILYQEMNYEPAYVDLKQQMNRERQSLIQTLSPIKKPSTPKKRAGLTWKAGWVFTVLAILVLAMTLIQSNHSIDVSYDNIKNSANFLAIQKVQAQIKSLWEGRAQEMFGFGSSSQQPSKAMQAFSAGLWKGTQDLELQLSRQPNDDWLNWLEKDWANTQWADYFDLGRWILLLEKVSQSVISPYKYEVPKGFWEQQKFLFADLKKDFLERQDKHDETEKVEVNWVISSFKYIEPLLKQLPDDKKPHLYENLAEELKDMREGLAPVS
jgi:hypothetical protein